MALIVTAIAAPVRAQSLPEEYRFAVGLYRQQRWDAAGDAFRKFLAKSPDHERAPYARLFLGLSLVNADRYSDARAVLRDYVRDYPRSKNLPDAMYRVGECSYLLDDLKNADGELESFLRQFPQHELAEWALPYLADTKLRLMQPDAAKGLFERALARYPAGRLAEDSRFGLARTFEELKKPDQAAPIYEQLAKNKIGARAAQSLMNLATIQFRAERFTDASKSFLRLAEEFPKSPLVASARLNAGFSFFQMSQYARAIEEFERASADKTKASEAKYWTGISLKASGDLERAAVVLKSAYESDPGHAVAEGALFYSADCELRLGRHERAKGLFLEVVRKWPKGEFADDSLHFAAEAALVGGSVDEASELARRFDREYRDSPLRLHEEILKGRILDAQAAAIAKHKDPDRALAEKLRREAIQKFEKVVSESSLPRTVALARFHLGRALQEAGEHARVIEVLASLADQARKPEASSEAIESLVIYGHSLHQLGKHKQAIAPLSTYLELRPKGRQAEQALADRALAYLLSGKRDAATADARRLVEQYADSPTALETLRRLAESAYDAEDWPAANELFTKMSELSPPKSDGRRIGLSGLGWVRFRQKSYDASSEAFGKVFEEFPADIAQVAEAGYMRGRALQDAGKLPEAAKAYAGAFQKLSPTGAAAEGAEATPPAQYGYLAGVQTASVNTLLKRYADADDAYRLVAERFPKAKRLDTVLVDWANVLYAADKSAAQEKRIRDTLRRVVREHPGGAASQSARLFLAELDLIAGKKEAAEAEFRSLVSDPKTESKVREDSLTRLIALAVDREEWAPVRDYSQKFLAEFGTSRDARLVHLHLGSAQLGLKDLPAAEKSLSGLKQELAGDTGPMADWWARVWVLLAEAYHQQKKYPQVEATVDELRRRMPKSTLLYQADEILGRTYKNQAQWDKALAAFERVIEDRQDEQNPTAAKSQLMIAEMYFLRKEFEQAKTAYLKVYTLYENLPEWRAPALLQVARCEEALNQAPRAEKTYAELIRSFPSTDYAKEAKKRLDELQKRTAG